MKSDRHSRPRFISLAIFILGLILVWSGIYATGCSLKPQPQKSSPNETNKSNNAMKASNDLKTLLSDLNTIVLTLTIPAGMSETPPELINPSSQTGGDSSSRNQTATNQSPSNQSRPSGKAESGNQKSNDQNKDQEKDSKSNLTDDTTQNKNQKPSTQKNTTGAMQPTAPEKGTNEQAEWDKVDMLVQGLHQKWNSLEPQIIEQGSHPEWITGFETQLTKLTNETKDRKVITSLLTANEAYQYIAYFWGLFPNHSPPELHRLRYHTNAILLQSQVKDWSSSKGHLNQLKEEWDHLRPQLAEGEQNLTSQFELSLLDLQTVLEEKDEELIKIKSIVVLSNIRKLDKQFSQKQSENKSEQGPEKTPKST